MSFTMEVMNTSSIKEEVIEQIQPVSEEVKKLQEMAQTNVSEIMAIDLDSFEKKRPILQSIESFGMSTMRNSTNKNALLKAQIGTLAKGGEEGGAVAQGLVALQTQIKDLDPSLVDFTKTGLLGKLFNPMRAYFAKYQRADDVIADIIESLTKGREILKNDNITLGIEQQSLRELTKKLQQEIQLGILMDEAIEVQVNQAITNGEDAEKIKFVNEEVLFPLRQRVMDMQQMIVVNQQGILAMEVIMRNNKELMRGVDRAKNVTVSALKTAVTVASALYNQKIVLKKIELLNETTNTLIQGTSKMLKEQGVEIQKQAMESSISTDTMKQAFSDVIESLESISVYKLEALPKMRETISQFREIADIGENQIKKLEQGSLLSLSE